MAENEISDREEPKIYELGFHIISSIPEDKLSGEAAAVKAVLERHQAVFIAEEFPKLKHLAYTMKKSVGGHYQRFDAAYFGWIKFELAPSAIESVEQALKTKEAILRFLLIKTVMENTMAAPRTPFHKPVDKIPRVDINKEGKLSGEVKSPISEAELDKSIEALIAE